MTKRILCALLTLIMLMSLVPMGAISASAAATSMSEAGITVLKKLEIFRSTCSQDGQTNHWSIGYGTTCDEDHVDENGNPVAPHEITEREADIAFRAALDAVEDKVVSFASINGLSLTQGQFDALVSFTYNCGTAWMNGTGLLKTAVVNGYTGNDFLNAICVWDTVQGTPAVEARRMIEANMYLNNSYSHIAPREYVEVTLNACGGHMTGAGTITQYIDTRLAEPINVTPVKNGYTFMGWYNAPQDAGNGVLVTNLTSAGTLYAYWQNDSDYTEVMYTMPVSEFTSRQAVANPWSYAEPVGTPLAADATVTVIKEYVDYDGHKWVQILEVEGGWFKVGAYTGDSGYGMDVIVTVTNTYVNIRSSSTIYSSTVRKARLGEKLRIVETKQGGDGYFWGRVMNNNGEIEGWVALVYTDYNEVVNQNPSNEENNTTDVIATAVIRCQNYINVRSGAGTHNAIVGSLADGTKVSIYEVTIVNNVKWGRTSLGWISLAYADVTMLTAYNTNSTKVDNFYGWIPEKAEFALRVDAGMTTDYVRTADGQLVILYRGNDVIVKEMKTVNGSVWAKVWRTEGGVTKEGWMEYQYIQVGEMDYIVAANSLNVYENTNGINVMETLPQGYEVTVVDVEFVQGVVWGKIYVGNVANHVTGWIELNSNVRRESTTTEDTSENMRSASIVGAQDVNVRKDPGLFGAKVTTVAYGTTVMVDTTSESKHSGGMWVKIYVGGEYLGWICTDYLEYIDVVGGTSSESNGEGAIVGTGIVTSSVGLAVRQGAGLGYPEVGRLSEGANVTVLEKKMSGGMIWGRINEGWICLSYVQMLTSGTTGEGVMGTVANTYGGLNIRASASTSSALVGKLLPGARVEIFEQKRVGNAMWGRISQGWVSMAYIALDSEDDFISGGNDSEIGSGSTITTSAAFTGTITTPVNVYLTAVVDGDNIACTMNHGDTVTVHELLTVQTVEEEDVEAEDGTLDTNITTTKTTFWARTNKGFIKDPANYIALNALEEQVYTVTGSDALNVRVAPGANSDLMDFKLAKGEQVIVTELQIVKSTVWGKVKTSVGEVGWASLSYMTKGAVSGDSGSTTPSVPENNTGNNTDSGNTTNPGFTPNGTPGFTPNGSTGSTSYKYTGKIIRSDGVKIRATASTNAAITTTMDKGDALVVYETTLAEGKVWGRCDAGWVYLYYVDLVPAGSSAIDARIVYNEGTAVYDSANNGNVIGTYSKMTIIDIYEQVGSWVRTESGWVHTDNLL